MGPSAKQGIFGLRPSVGSVPTVGVVPVSTYGQLLPYNIKANALISSLQSTGHGRHVHENYARGNYHNTLPSRP